VERIMTVTGADGEESLERTLNELAASGAILRSVAWKEGAGLWFVWSTSGALPPPATTERITTVTGADGGESLEAALNELKASGATLREVVWKEAGYWVVWSTSGTPFPTTTTVPPATTTTPPPTTTTAPPVMTTTAPPTTTVPPTTTAPLLATTTVPPTTTTTVPPTTAPPVTTTTAPPPTTTTTPPPPGFGAEANFGS